MTIDYSDRGMPMSNVTELASHRTGAPLHSAVSQAIDIMRKRYYERITLNDLSAEVYVSPFHFSRLFAKGTGATPGRYLTAVRMFEAKRLLLTTSLTVSDIVCSVGYSSVGTFTSRFSRAVGMTPSQYRDPDVGDLLVALAPHFRKLPSLEALRAAALGSDGRQRGGGTITARIEVPVGVRPGTIMVGVFGDSIPQCGPVAFTTVVDTRSTTVAVGNVPAGSWYVLAVGEHPTGDPSAPVMLSFGARTSSVTLSSDGTGLARVRMRPLSAAVPPIAFTLAGTGTERTRPEGPRATGAPSLRLIA